MKNVHQLRKSLGISPATSALPTPILLSGLAVFLVPMLLLLLYQFNQQRVDEQSVTDNRVDQVIIRHLGQLQRAHLRFYGLVSQSEITFDARENRLQEELVWSALAILESPFYTTSWSPEVLRMLQDYHADWQSIQPLIERWRAQPTDHANKIELLQRLDRADQNISRMSLIAQTQLEARLIDWGISTQRLNLIVTVAILVFMFLIVISVYMIYQFSRAQAHASQILRHSEQRLSALLDTIPDAVFRLSQTGIYLDVKPATNFELLAPIDGLIGKSLSETLPPHIAEGSMQVIAQALRTGKEQLYDYQLFDEQSAVMYYFEARIIPSGAAEVQAIIRNVTLEKQQEEMTLRSQKLESLGVLVGGIAHDFNNLLTGMLGQISLAKLKLGKGLPALENLDKARRSAERAADLTRQLLAYAGNGQFQSVPLDINALITDTVGLLELALPNHAELALALEEPLPLLMGDRGQLQQLVMNLFINAVEALEDRPGQIQITTRTQPTIEESARKHYIIDHLASGPYIVLQVADTGIGMDEAILHRIFEPFFSTKFTGRGLGLSATMGIIRTHHGGLQVQSQPGQGTTFTILFPMFALPLDTQPTRPVVDARAPIEPSAHLEPVAGEQPKHILIIDDEAAIREVAGEILADYGYGVMLADGGLSGIAQFRRRQTEVGGVLLDVRMPGMDGKQTYLALRQIDPLVKIMFVSGYSETELNTQLGDQQEIAFLPKPYSSDRLIHAVQTMLLPQS